MKFLKQLSIYTLVGVIGAGINFFVMPVLSHYLTPADYGLLSLFNVYITILIPIVSISAYSILGVDYFKQKDKKVFASQFKSIQVIPFITSAFLAIITWLFFGRFADELELSGLGIRWGYIIVALTFLSIYYEQFVQFLIVQKKASAFAVYTLLKVSLEVSLTFYFIIIKNHDWQGRMYSWLITSVIFFFVGLFYFKKEGLLRGRVQFHFIREAILFGAPLVLHGIGKFVVNQSDRLFIIKMVPNGISEAGIYNIGYTVGSLVMLGVNAFFNFYSPYLMERLTDLSDSKKLQIVKMSYYYVFGSLVLLLLISILAPPFFKYFIDVRYQEGVSFVFWVALGYCFWGGYMLFSGFIFYAKKSRILGWLAIFNVVSNLVFNYFFIVNFGAIGAAYATALSFFLLMLIVALITQKLIPMPWMEYSKLKSVKV